MAWADNDRIPRWSTTDRRSSAPTHTEATVCLNRRYDSPLASIEKTMTNRSPFSVRHDRPKPEWRGEIRSMPPNPALENWAPISIVLPTILIIAPPTLILKSHFRSFCSCHFPVLLILDRQKQPKSEFWNPDWNEVRQWIKKLSTSFQISNSLTSKTNGLRLILILLV